MFLHPFSILRPFTSHLTVSLFTKLDDIRSDADAACLIGAKTSAGLQQEHGAKTVIVRSPMNRTEKADGMITDVPGLALCIRAADCQNFLMYERTKNVLGVLHVGWKGLIAGAIHEFFRVLKEEWEIGPADVYIGAGPSLCAACAEFTDPVRELPGIPARFISGRCVDLQGAATEKFLELGVRPDHMERHPDCTKCHPENYWTYRGGDREKVKKGHTNMLAGVLQ